MAARAADGLLARIRARARRLVPFGRSSAFQLVIGPHYAALPVGGPLDPRRGERVLAFLSSERLVRRREVRRARVASLRALRRVHTDAYLESLQEPGSLVGILGFDPGDAGQDAYLLCHREQVGGTVLAAWLAATRGGLAVNLGGGFHHARAERGHGFCVFHDVAVAIGSLRAHGRRPRVLVVDLDLHDGDGTRALFAADPRVHTLSIHNRHLGPVDATESTSIALGDDVDDLRYLTAVREVLPPIVRAFRPDLAFYLAGVDPAIDDALGNWRVSAAALVERDRLVVDLLRGQDGPVPLVLVLAGGYGDAAWRHAARSLSAIARGAPIEPPRSTEETLASYRRAARTLRDLDLASEAGTDELGLTADDLDPALARRRHRRFLDFYSSHGLELALERYGFLERVRAACGGPIRLAIDVDAAGVSTLRIHPLAEGAEPLVELRLRRDERLVPGFTLLAVDWLLLQNPGRPFPAERPTLPGQRHPGLGLLPEIVALLVLACERLDLDGVAVVPAHYHVAALAAEEFRFVSPRSQARFDALAACLAGMRLAQALSALEGGAVREARTGQTVRWEPAPMVRPVRGRLRERIEGPAREREVGTARAELHFELLPGGTPGQEI